MLQVDIQKQLGSFRLETQFSAENETMALLGASGSGKSLTLRCIAGIERPDQGRIVLDGQVLYDSAAKINLPPQRRQVGYLFQQYALFPTMTVEQNILAGLHGCPRRDRKQEALDIIRRFRLTGLEKKLPSQLSDGEQQRVALGRILAAKPKVVLLDEPFSALDSYLKWGLELELGELLSDFSGSILWVTHDRDEAYRHCRRVCIMDRGHSSVTTMEHLLHEPQTVSAARLSGCKNFIACKAVDGRIQAPDWGISLCCGSIRPGASVLGIPAAAISLEGDANPLPCRVARVIRDVNSTIVLARPLSALPGTPPLRAELLAGFTIAEGDSLQLYLNPQKLLPLLEES